MDSITLMPISLLIESPTNPRKTFDEGDLQELADNIKANGILQPIVARPVTHSTGFEIVFGHRRFRAAQLADLDQVPVIVRAMTDEHVLIAQLSENLARADVHPIEEADAFDRLIREHGYTIEQLMEQTGKSRTAVYNRLKLASLTPEVRKACIELGVGAEIATRIARVPAPLQQQALNRVTIRGYGAPNVIEIFSDRQAREALQRGFTLPLAKAIFDTEDDTLPGGRCSTCPRNTDNEPALAELGAWVCTDTSCHQLKEIAHDARRMEAAERLGVLLPNGSDTVDLGREYRWDPQTHADVTWGDLIKKAREQGIEVPQVYIYADGDAAVECLKRADADQLAAKMAPPKADRPTPSTAARGDDEEDDGVQAPARTPAQVKLAEDWDAIKAAVFLRITRTQRTTEDLRLMLLVQLELSGELDRTAEEWLGWPSKIKSLEESGMHENDARLQMLQALTPDEMAAALLIGAISDLADTHWGGVSDARLRMRERIAALYRINVFEPDAGLASEQPERDPRVADMFETSTAEVAP